MSQKYNNFRNAFTSLKGEDCPVYQRHGYLLHLQLLSDRHFKSDPLVLPYTNGKSFLSLGQNIGFSQDIYGRIMMIIVSG